MNLLFFLTVEREREREKMSSVFSYIICLFFWKLPTYLMTTIRVREGKASLKLLELSLF